MNELSLERTIKRHIKEHSEMNKNEIKTIENRVCEWEKAKYSIEDIYKIGCNNDVRGISDNMKFCPYCGGKIEIKEI